MYVRPGDKIRIVEVLQSRRRLAGLGEEVLVACSIFLSYKKLRFLYDKKAPRGCFDDKM